VVVHEISDDDEFLVVACDGIWDCLSSQNVTEFVRRGIATKQELHLICENLMNNCLASNSETGGVGCDNMTMLIVGLLREKTKDEWYDMIARRVADGDGPCAPPEYADLKYPGRKRAFSNDLDDDGRESNGITPTLGGSTAPSDGAEVLTVSDADMLNDEQASEKDDEAPTKETKLDDIEMADILTKPSHRLVVTDATKKSGDTAKKSEDTSKKSEDTTEKGGAEEKEDVTA